MTAIRRQIRWRLRVMMAERGITTVTELARRLDDHGLSISSQQLTRVVSRLPDRLSTRLLAALIDVLACGVGDLIVLEEAPPGRDGAPRHPVNGTAKRPRAKSATRKSRPGPTANDRDIVGPGYGNTFDPPKRGGS